MTINTYFKVGLMKRLCLLLVGLASALMIGCASPKTNVDTTWIDRPSSVKIVFSEPVVGSPKDLADDLPEYVDRFSDWFKERLIDELDNRSKRLVEYSADKVGKNKIGGILKMLDGEKFAVPKITPMKKADVYIVIDDIWFGRTTELAYVATPNGGSINSIKYFSVKCAFAIHDAKTNAIYSYGYAKGSSQFTFTVAKGDWWDVMHELASQIIYKTPLDVD